MTKAADLNLGIPFTSKSSLTLALISTNPTTANSSIPENLISAFTAFHSG